MTVIEHDSEGSAVTPEARSKGQLAMLLRWFGAGAEYIQAALWHPLAAGVGWDLRRPSPSGDLDDQRPHAAGSAAHAIAATVTRGLAKEGTDE